MRTADTDTPTLQSLLHATEQRQNLCVLTVLTWVASCDGTIDDEELELLRNVAASVAGGEAALPAAIDVGRLGRTDDLEFACRYLRNHVARADRPLLAQLFVTMAAQDGQLTVAENHVLRFLADLLALSARKFSKLFEQLTRRPFPEVGDVSSIEWWRRRDAGEEAKPPEDGWGRDPTTRARDSVTDPAAGGPPPPQEAPTLTRASALRMFGLEEGATEDALREAYRRLAKARHPDRYARLGPAAQATATAAFTRVRAAYELLSAAMARA